VKKQRIHSCNVLDPGPAAWRLWHFSTDRDNVKLESEQTVPPATPLPSGVVEKDWQTLWQPRINIAFLPANQVFLRVVQLPIVERGELLSMLEFQLEKLSPLPVTQVLWSVEVLPSRTENEQTAIVCIVARDVIEKFVGTLEADNYQPDRLEVPQLNQVIAGGVKEDGAWIYPEKGQNLCLVTWWRGGTLQNVQLLRLPADDLGPVLQEQLTQTMWAGELEGWLSLPARWHLVADPETAASWQLLIQLWSDDPVEVHAPLSSDELARFSAQRVARGDAGANLLPVEFSARYHQQFIDRLWMRGLGAVVALYCVGVFIYFVALQAYGYRENKIETQVRSLAGSYTNALQLKERVQILQDQVNLKYAALDCWKAASELLPEDFTLTWLIFGKGRTLELHGTAPQGQEPKVTDFNEALRGAMANGQLLFSSVTPPRSTSRAGTPTFTWSFSAELNRSEIE
jgi:hypothetical protein